MRIYSSDVINGKIDHININEAIEIDCSGCQDLTELPLWPTIKKIRCSGCKGLTKLPMWSSIEKVICPKCTGLTELPLWNTVKEINCSGCTSLSKLPMWESIEYVDCFNCTGLTELPYLDTVQIIVSNIQIQRIYFKGDCVACSSENTDITKCTICVWSICRDCYNNWHVNRSECKCMYCNGTF